MRDRESHAEAGDSASAPPTPRPRKSWRDRIMHASFVLTRPMTLGVRGVALDGEGRVLLVKHGYTPGWHFPGGGVEPGETCEQALLREMEEEASVALEPPLRLHGLFHNSHVSPRDHVAVYVARRFRVLGERAPDREILAARFFALEALPEDATRATRARLAEILEGRPLSPTW
jgi:8-oxo-dGTP pyrophosphatase MutT (NUDIX family)